MKTRHFASAQNFPWYTQDTQDRKEHEERVVLIHQIFFARAIGLNASRDANNSVGKRLEYINNSLHLARKYARTFVRGHIICSEN